MTTTDHTRHESFLCHIETAIQNDLEKLVQKQQSWVTTLNFSTTAGLQNVEVIQACFRTTAVSNIQIHVEDSLLLGTFLASR